MKIFGYKWDRYPDFMHEKNWKIVLLKKLRHIYSENFTVNRKQLKLTRCVSYQIFWCIFCELNLIHV